MRYHIVIDTEKFPSGSVIVGIAHTLVREGERLLSWFDSDGVTSVCNKTLETPSGRTVGRSWIDGKVEDKS